MTDTQAKTKLKSKPKNAILWLIRQGFYLYVQKHDSILSMAFSPESVRYFDVVNETQLQLQIEQFLQKNSMPALSTFIIVGKDALMEKDFSIAQNTDKDLLKEQFLDLVPYENIFSKTWIKDTTMKVVAVGNDVYKSIRTVIEKYGGTVNSLVPYFVTGQESPDKQLFESLLKKPDVFREENMITKESKQVIRQTSSEKPRSSLPLLLGVFGFLVLVLIGVIIWQMKQTQPAEQKSNTVHITPSIERDEIKTRSLNETRTASSSSQISRNILIKIEAVTNNERVRSVQSELERLEYTKIEFQQVDGSTNQANMILFKPSVDTKIRDEITTVLNKLRYSPLIQENSTIDADVHINVFK